MLNRSSPQSAGFDPARLERALAIVGEWVEAGVVPGVVVLVARRGRIAASAAYGRMSEEAGARPMEVSTSFAVASLTKVVTASAVLKQIEAGKAALETPVREILPGWRVQGSEGVTLRHLLSHTSGLPEDLAKGTLNYDDANSLDVILDAFMKVPPVKEQGEELIYSNIGFGLLGRVIERLSGYGYREAVWRTVLGPLWMNDTWFGNPPRGKEESVAKVAGTSRAGTPLDPYNSSYYRELATPWGGMFASAEDLAKLAQAYLDNGKPLLEAGTALSATRNWTNGLYGGFSGWRSFPTGDWGLGWEVKGSRGRHWTGERPRTPLSGTREARARCSGPTPPAT